MAISNDLQKMVEETKELERDYAAEDVESVLSQAVTNGRTDVLNYGHELLGEPVREPITRENLSSRLSRALGYKPQDEADYRRQPGFAGEDDL